MNRKETQLLVENWRKVLDEGLYDQNTELLNENFLKKIKGITTGLLMMTALGAMSPGTAFADVSTDKIKDTAVKVLNLDTEGNNFHDVSADAFAETTAEFQKASGLSDEEIKEYTNMGLEVVQQAVKDGLTPVASLDNFTEHLKNKIKTANKLKQKAEKNKKGKSTVKYSETQMGSLSPETKAAMERLEKARKKAERNARTK